MEGNPEWLSRVRCRRVYVPGALGRWVPALRAAGVHERQRGREDLLDSQDTEPRMQPGLVGFKELLKEFRGLSIWAVGGSVAVPFAAALVSLSPPWPPAI